MKRGASHVSITLSIAAILSTITIVATYIFNDWSARFVYNIFFFTFLNFTVLLFNTTFFTKHPRFLSHKKRKFLRILFLLGYSSAYIIATASFIRTGQIISTQTLLFISGINTVLVTAIYITVIALTFFLVALLFYKKIELPIPTPQDRKILKILLYVGGILLIATVLINTTYLNINEGMITNEEVLINYQRENMVLPPILSENITADSPNVIFILLESLNAERIGIYGNTQNITPNMDKLGRESIVFTNTYTMATHSDYAQTGLLSSRYVFSSEYHNVPSGDSPRKFVWDIFKENDYITGYYSSQDDRWQGMDLYLNYENLDNFSYSKTDGETDYGFRLEEKDYDHKTADLALRWLNETIQKPKPFFLYLNFQATHAPREYPDEYSYFKPDDSGFFDSTENVTENQYKNAIRYIDIQIGRILDYLEKENKSENTLIVLTSDHGEDHEERHGISAHGKSIYNEELIVPAIMKIPGVEPMIIEEKISHIDLVPTLITILGYPIPKEFQGDIMRKGRPIFFVTQSHKYLIGMIKNDTKVILDINRDLSEVYNIAKDPNELNELDPTEYPGEIMELLFWSYCQRNYYNRKKWIDFSPDRCTENNNFKV
jgi:arylsulfatase A-like enzyme